MEVEYNTSPIIEEINKNIKSNIKNNLSHSNENLQKSALKPKAISIVLEGITKTELSETSHNDIMFVALVLPL